MIFCLLGACLAVFVPWSVTDTFGLHMPKPDHIERALGKHKTIVVLTLKRKDAALAAAFMEMKRLFPEAHLMFVPHEFLPEHMNMTTTKSPCLMFFHNKKMEASIGPIWDDITMATMIDLYLTKKRPILNDKVDLVGALGGAPKTILVLEEDFNKALTYITETGTTHGPANVVTCSQALFTELGLNKGDCALFRKEDDTLEPLAPCSIESYKNMSVPKYYKTGQTALKSKGLVAALMTDGADRDEGVASILPQLKGFFPEMDFVIADDVIKNKIDVIDGNNWSHWNSNVAVVNFRERYSYNLTKYFPDSMKQAKFDPLAWGNTLAEALLAITQNNVTKVYMSEATFPESSWMVQSVSGKDYQAYLNDTEHDLLILFIQEKSRESSKLVKTCSSIARELERTNQTNCKFLIVDIAKNSIPGGFPIKAKGLPLVGFVPKDNKRLMLHLPPAGEHVLKWFMKRYSATPHTLNFTLPGLRSVTKLAEKADIMSKYMDPISVLSMKKVLSDLRADESPVNSDEL